MNTLARRVTVEVPWRTLFKIVAVVASIWLVARLSSIILLLIVSVLLAVVLDPVVARAERRGVGRGAAVALLGLAIAGVTGLFAWFLWASVVSQAQLVTSRLVEIEATLTALAPAAIVGLFESSGRDAGGLVATYALGLLRSAASGAVVVVLAFILTLYLLADGRRTYAWLLAFVPHARRPQVDATAVEVQRVMFGYALGNLATSAFAFVFVLVTMNLLKVPAALLLALVAGVLDFVPVIGFIASVVPAVALAATVSGRVALVVAVLYGAYHLVENYVIAPRVYGGRLQLSDVAIVIAFAVGAELGGVVGAAIALPVAAAYPAVERLWLREQLPPGAAEEHRAIEQRSA